MHVCRIFFDQHDNFVINFAACDMFFEKLCANATPYEELVCELMDEACKYLICDIDKVY